MKIFRRLGSVILSLITILLFSACSTTEDKNSIADSNSDAKMPIEAKDAGEVGSTQGIESLEPVLTLGKAVELFYNVFENKTINFESIEFQKNDTGNYRYFIKGWDDKYNYELEVDAGTAEIIEQEMRVPVEISDTLDLEAAITPKDAMNAALEGMPEEAVEGWELKVDENNRMIYGIRFLSGENQIVDGLIGRVQ